VLVRKAHATLYLTTITPVVVVVLTPGSSGFHEPGGP